MGRDLMGAPENPAGDPTIVPDPSDVSITHAANGRLTLSVLDGGRVFKRKAIKAVGTPHARQVCWLVAELNGVRVYIDGDKLVMSSQDLYP
jgi:hypothetical protein